ncbi:hypothetical protein QJS04_geneDACA010272 [Acorus gramineus]|uniref:Translocation protein SEC62 n=1 Tax=Acorus gramineus TaxID=55184 RepID=A0AAV9A6V6_ACOGR|nr:hypothetical protein QJS04_geneDACA010272 [Acorus gramineus]
MRVDDIVKGTMEKKRRKKDQVFSENDAFFAWTFLKRRTLWMTILSFSWPLLALAICLFPRPIPHYGNWVPHLVRNTIKDTDLRALVFGALWIILGKRVWIFPNILAEETTFKELVQFWPIKDEEENPKWASRLFYALVAVLIILLLRHHAPDEAARARYQKRVSNIIDDVLEWSPKLALSGMMEKQQQPHETAFNSTEAEETADGSRTSTADDSEISTSTNGVEGEDIIDDDAVDDHK